MQDNLEEKIKELETETQKIDFGVIKNKAQAILKELAELKAKLGGALKYDKGNAIITIISALVVMMLKIFLACF